MGIAGSGRRRGISLKVLCIDCKHFHRHREIQRGPFWSDDLEEVDSIFGDCRESSPKAHWLTGKGKWPVVTTGHSCSKAVLAVSG